MNDLIAVDGTEAFHQFAASVEDPTKMLDYAPVVGDCYDAAKAFGEGDWAGGLQAAASAGTAIAAAVSDPLGTLMSSCAAFLLDYMPPLPQMLDVLAGNPALVMSIGETWVNVSRALTERAAALEAAMSQMLAKWRGAAADAYRARMEFLIGLTTGLSSAAMGIGCGFAVASTVVEFVRTIVRDLIADLVGRLISYVIETGATLGAALPVVIGQASIAIADTATSALKWTGTLTDAIKKAIAILEKLKAAIEAVDEAITEVTA
ncbi:WXG100 family type VII secretion target [Ruania zhangjianzhongii]|uniref:WXG100 family type VII secretion target n=1 Tax=Ruania zhangjianzhongii TaxID=2603206 RepID=UPI0011C94A33|nr:hypothetical protein [Ruania zhangjianzhongii]